MGVGRGAVGSRPPLDFEIISKNRLFYNVYATQSELSSNINVHESAVDIGDAAKKSQYRAAFLNLFLPQHTFWSRLSSPATPTIR